jgi:hypothetical protein
MKPWILVVIAVDIIVTTLVLRRVLARRAANQAGPAAPGLFDIRKLRAFTDEIHPRIGEYVRANWSGQSDTLPGVLSAVLDDVSATANRMGLALDREVLKRVVESSLAKHGAAKSDVVREALKQVA